MKIRKILVSCVTMILIVAMVATGFVFAAPNRQQSTNGNINYAPDSGIRWNPGAGYFEVYNYAGLTHIGSDKFISTTGDTSAAAEVAGSIKKATMADTYNLMQDIYFEESDASVARSQAEFTGTLDGRGMQLINLPMQKIGAEDKYFGLFASTSGNISNIIVKNPNFDSVSSGNVGTIAFAMNGGKISNSQVLGSVTKSENIGFGGFVYSVSNSVSAVEFIDCKNDLDITTGGNVGGIIGATSNVSVTMKNTANNANLSGNVANGLAGGASRVGYFTAYNCTNTGILTGKLASYDFSYQNSGTLDNCYGANGSVQTPSGLPYVLKMVTNGGTFTVEGAATIGEDYMLDKWTGESATLPTEGARPNYNFVGWFTTSNFAEGTNVTSVNSQYMANGFVTVYAKWINANADGIFLFELIDNGNAYSVALADDFYGDIVIPAEYKGKPVTTIADKGFADSSITSAVIPDSITILGVRAFSGCSNLKTVQLPAAVPTSTDTYSPYPFDGSGLESVEIPSGWTKITKEMFRGCANLTSVTLNEGLVEIEGAVFYSCTSLPEITFPQSLEIIGQSAFGDCEKFTAMHFPKNVHTIAPYALPSKPLVITVDPENAAFEGAGGALIEKATKILIRGYDRVPNGVRTIKSGAFSNSTVVKDVVVPNSVITIENNAFYKSSITSLHLPASLSSFLYLGVTKSLQTITIDSANVHYKVEGNCLIVKSSNSVVAAASFNVVIPDYIKVLGVKSFAGLQMETINIPASVKTIGSNAFEYSELTSVVIPDTVTTVGSAVFYESKKLQSVRLPSTLNKIPSMLFLYCTSLTDVSIPDGVTMIEYRAFAGCTSLQTLFIPKSVVNIDCWYNPSIYAPFKDCPNLILSFEAAAAPSGDWNYGQNMMLFNQTRPANR